MRLSVRLSVSRSGTSTLSSMFALRLRWSVSEREPMMPMCSSLSTLEISRSSPSRFQASMRSSTG